MKRKSRIAFISIPLIIIMVVLILVNGTKVYADTLYIDFNNGKLSSSQLQPMGLPTPTTTMNLDLSGGGPITSYKVTINGAVVASGGQLPGNMVSVNANGVAKQLTGISFTNPGHHIYRQPDGLVWEHQASTTVPIHFTADASTISGGVSQYPGAIPSTGKDRSGNIISPYPTDLRYDPAHSDDGLPDYAPDWNAGGAAVTHAYEVSPPSKFYTDLNNAKNDTGITYNVNTAIDKSSVTIYNAVPDPSTPTAQPFYWGASATPGFGQVKVRMMLDDSQVEGVNYIRNAVSGYAEDRNYLMSALSYWHATTYLYQGTVEVTYDMSKPDLIPTGLTINGAMTLNTPTNFEFRFKNIGSKININNLPSKKFDIRIYDKSNNSIIATKTYQQDMDPGQEFVGTFNYSFSTPGTKYLAFAVDFGNDIDEGNTGGETNNVKDYEFSVDIGINGGFTINPPGPIKFRDNFTLTPTTFTIPNSCVYQEHYYKFSANGTDWYSQKETSQTASTSFPYPLGRPDNFTVGSNQIAMKIVTSCGTSGWLSEKTLSVVEDPNNRPPQFDAGWFHSGDNNNTRPPFYVVKGDYVDVRIIHNNTVTPNTPYDPDGDLIHYTWDFDSSSSAWARQVGQDLKSYYGNKLIDEGYRRIKADVTGNHNIKVTADDGHGGQVTRNVSLSVLDPNPIPVAACPPSVKENRTVPAGSINGDNSWSPPGRGIDHTKDVWSNKLTSYTNGTLSDIQTTVTLSQVTDSSGLPSLGSSSCNIVVKPDFPPVAKLQVPSINIRGQQVKIYNNSYSPDGDNVVSMKYKYKYDANNNGFADDAWIDIPSTDLNSFTFTPATVGKYMFYAEATEDYGKVGNTSTQNSLSLTMDVVNNAPQVSVSITGQNPQPDISPPEAYSPSTILSQWSLFDVNGTAPITNNYQWMVDNGTALKAGLGKGMERQTTFTKYAYGGYGPSPIFSVWTPFPDAGYGANGISPYKSLTNVTNSTPILIPTGYGVNRTGYISPTTDLTPVSNPNLMRSNKQYFYFDADGYLWAWNKSKVPQYYAQDWTDMSNMYAPNGKLKHHWTNGVNPYDFVISLNTAPSGFPTTIAVPYYSQADQTAHPNWSNEAYNGDFSHASGTTSVSQSVSPGSVDVTGDTIYQTGIVTKPGYAYYSTCANYSDDNCYPGTANGGTTSKIAVFSYDAYSGTLLDNSYGKGTPSVSASGYHMTNKGSNLLLYQFGGSGMVYTEFDRHGNIIANGSVGISGSSGTYAHKYKNYFGQLITDAAAGYWCGWNNNDYSAAFNKDDLGNIYFYNQMTCTSNSADIYGNHTTLDPYMNPEAPAGLYILKINVKDFTLQNLGRLGGMQSNHFNLGPWDAPTDADAIMYIDPFSRQILTRSYHVYPCNGCYSQQLDSWNQSVNMDGGGVWDNGIAISQGTGSTWFHMNTAGDYPSGWCTPTASGGCDGFNNHTGQRMQYNWTIFGHNNWYARNYSFGQYFGDGFWVSGYGGGTEWVAPGWGQNNGDSNHYLFIDSGPVASTQVYKSLILGQYVSPFTLGDVSMTFSMAMEHPTEDSSLAGFSFRMQNPRNRYAIESDGSNLYLSRYIGGNRAVLATQPYAFDNSTYSFKITAIGDKIDVWMNGIPVFHDIHEGTFASGSIGPFTDKSFVSFIGIGSKIDSSGSQWLTGYAILDDPAVGASVQYDNLTYTDPENDPMAGSFQWSFTHTPKFLNNMGLDTVLNGQTFNAEQLRLNKVGIYTIGLAARDDPFPSLIYKYPNMTFDSYRKASNVYTQRVIVHRRPIAAYGLSVNTDGSIAWTDSSYDPDRYDPTTGAVSADDEGKTYGSNHGIFEHKYWYISPSGNTVGEKLVRPAETGDYGVTMAVRDEYGAWSTPVTTHITAKKILPPNKKPIAVLTVPNGTQRNPVIMYTQRPQLTMNQSDPDVGTTFQGYHFKILDASGKVITESGEAAQWTTSPTVNWTPSIDLELGGAYQVMARTYDGELWSDWSNVGWMRIDSAPTAVLTNPNGLNDTTPTVILNDLRPTFTWDQNDIDGGNLSKFRMQIYKKNTDGTESMIYDQVKNQNNPSSTMNFQIDSDLPNGIPLYAKVQVFDGFLWSTWSNKGWFTINLPPTATLTNPVGNQANPTPMGIKPLITWTQTDPDQDTTFTKLRVLIQNSSNTTIYDSGEVTQNTKSSDGSFKVPTSLPAGQVLKVRVMVWDEYQPSLWSASNWILTDRPPVPDFKLPVALYEGDSSPIINLSNDPDPGDNGNLANVWKITNPVGITTTLTSNGLSFSPKYTFAIPGLYNISLTSTDEFGIGASITKSVEVKDLVISPTSLPVAWGPSWSPATQSPTLNDPSGVQHIVHHFNPWEENRLDFNKKNPLRMRGYNTYYRGEGFVLSSSVTNTGTQTYADNATVILQDVIGNIIDTVTSTDMNQPITSQRRFSATDGSNINWSGWLVNDLVFSKLVDGDYSITINYQWGAKSNIYGITNTHNETYTELIKIKDGWMDYVNTYRVN